MNKTTKSILWGVGLAALGVGVYFGVTAILNRNNEPEGDATAPVADPQSGGELGSKAPTTKPKINANKWLKKGMKDPSDSAEIKYTQAVINKMIKSAKSVRWNTEKMSKLPNMVQIAAKTLAGLSYLSPDGDYGDNTANAVKAITAGTANPTSQTSLCQMRRNYQAFNKAVGHGDPYKNWGNICSNY